MAMPALRVLQIDNCKLRYLPPGLSSSKRLGLRQLNLYELSNLTSVENFPSVVEVDVFDCPKLTRIREDQDSPLHSCGVAGRSPIT